MFVHDIARIFDITHDPDFFHHSLECLTVIGITLLLDTLDVFNCQDFPKNGPIYLKRSAKSPGNEIAFPGPDIIFII